MTISQILRHKDGNIFKINTQQSIGEASALLTGKGIGALLVEGNNASIVGILSERDIVRGMPPHGADLHDVRVSELMTTNIVSCSPEDTVLEAMAMMTDRRIRHLPVYEDGNLIGLISLGDLVKSRIAEVQEEAEAMRSYINS